LQLRDDFEESVPMSTYLVAFVVCDYHKKSMVTQNQISVSVYAPQHQLNRAEFALETATTLMDFFENFFNVSYSLPKQGNTIMSQCSRECLTLFSLCRSNRHS
jgi:aminopeptidase N